MMKVVSCVAMLHNLWLVGLAALVCIGGGWVGLHLFRRARSRSGRQREGWTFLAAVATGSSVWCTHFIAMLAYEVAAPITFEPVLTMLSLLIAIVGATAAFTLGRGQDSRHVGLGGGLLGLSIAAMHYSGMMAYRVDGFVTWEWSFVAASISFAVFCGIASLLASAREMPLASLGLFIGAVVGLHFTGMTAISVEPFLTGAPIAGGAAVGAMAVAVAGVALLIVGTGVVSYIIDSDATEKNVETLRKMAMNDILTGLPNRISFNEYLSGELERASVDQRKLAVVGVDLDKFKEINDSRGHEAGDRALKIVASRMTSITREGEFVARIGGDEFAAVKRFSQPSELHDFVARLEAQLFEPIVLDDFQVASGASIGVSVFPHDGQSAARLISNADLAMYRAKTDVGTAVCYYEAGMDEAARARRDLAHDLRVAIERGQFELHYQVQENVRRRGQVVGYEALLRWTHPVRGQVSPAEFIPLAEETGTILQIGEWVLRRACKEASRRPELSKIAVNISAIQLSHGDLARLVHEVLLETGLSPSRLELEITESAIIQDRTRSLHVLRQIRALGVTVALDDFGTGYSSLETLRSFPFDRIKLDRSFMHEAEHSPQARAIIRAVLALGRSLHISVLAEGVETEQQLDLLKSEGCNEAQGYLLGRPEALHGEPSVAVRAA